MKALLFFGTVALLLCLYACAQDLARPEPGTGGGAGPGLGTWSSVEPRGPGYPNPEAGYGFGGQPGTAPGDSVPSTDLDPRQPSGPVTPPAPREERAR